jgi:hypothetical protein
MFSMGHLGRSRGENEAIESTIDTYTTIQTAAVIRNNAARGNGALGSFEDQQGSSLQRMSAQLGSAAHPKRPLDPGPASSWAPRKSIDLLLRGFRKRRQGIDEARFDNCQHG